MNAKICLYVNNKQAMTFPSLFDAVECAVADALYGNAVKVVCNGETIIDWAEGFIQKVLDKEGKQ